MTELTLFKDLDEARRKLGGGKKYKTPAKALTAENGYTPSSKEEVDARVEEHIDLIVVNGINSMPPEARQAMRRFCELPREKQISVIEDWYKLSRGVENE